MFMNTDHGTYPGKKSMVLQDNSETIYRPPGT
jgi:hypothetical protein